VIRIQKWGYNPFNQTANGQVILRMSARHYNGHRICRSTNRAKKFELLLEADVVTAANQIQVDCSTFQWLASILL